MKTYELVIEQRQPTCGGKSPTKCEIRTVQTDDPVAYVKELEPNGEEGSLVVRIDQTEGQWVKYIFTED